MLPINYKDGMIDILWHYIYLKPCVAQCGGCNSTMFRKNAKRSINIYVIWCAGGQCKAEKANHRKKTKVKEMSFLIYNTPPIWIFMRNLGFMKHIMERRAHHLLLSNCKLSQYLRTRNFLVSCS